MRFIFLLYVLGMLTSTSLVGQTYVGEVFYRSGYEYLKIVVTDTSALVSLPYLDGRASYPLLGQRSGGDYFLRKGQRWDLDLDKKTTNCAGTLLLKGQRQSVTLWKQQPPLEESALPTYEGVFQDSTGQRTVIYAENGYLHMMSPYSERTMSLKPIGEHRFWTVSGVVWEFLPSDTVFQIEFRNGSRRSLQRLPKSNVEEHWIPYQQDTLYAKVFYPPTTRQSPACLVLPGGGSVGMKNYEYEARYFAAQGLVAMVFDKSGNGLSKGNGDFRRQTFTEKLDQYTALYRYVQQLPQVDAQRVGVHGPSEGGRLALMMAGTIPEMAFANATAAPIMTMREGQLYAVAHYHRQLGLSEGAINDIVSLWNDYYEGIIEEDIPETVIERANRFRNLHERMFLPPNSTQVPASPSAEDLKNNTVVTHLSQINCPVFLQYGENDERVHASASIRNFKQHIAPNVLYRIEEYPRANHSFMTPEFEISHGYLDDKLVWLQQIGILKQSP